VVQPLNELAEREVFTPEIEEILKALDQINADLADQEMKLDPLGNSIKNLADDVDEMLDADKERKL